LDCLDDNGTEPDFLILIVLFISCGRLSWLPVSVLLQLHEEAVGWCTVNFVAPFIDFFDSGDSDILLNVFLAIAVDNLADAQSLSETENEIDENNDGKLLLQRVPIEQVRLTGAKGHPGMQVILRPVLVVFSIPTMCTVPEQLAACGRSQLTCLVEQCVRLTGCVEFEIISDKKRVRRCSVTNDDFKRNGG